MLRRTVVMIFTYFIYFPSFFVRVIARKKNYDSAVPAPSEAHQRSFGPSNLAGRVAVTPLVWSLGTLFCLRRSTGSPRARPSWSYAKTSRNKCRQRQASAEGRRRWCRLLRCSPRVPPATLVRAGGATLGGTGGEEEEEEEVDVVVARGGGAGGWGAVGAMIARR